MKKILFAVLSLFLIGSSYAQVSYLNGKATGVNVVMDFDGENSSVWVVVDSFSWNVCDTWKSWFPLTGKVDRWVDSYVYFTEPDDWNTVDTCVAIVLSWSEFILTGVAWTSSDPSNGSQMTFENIKLIYDSTEKAYYFSGNAIDDRWWSVPNWDTVYVTWLNLIDWNKTIVDYSNLTWWTLVANGLSGNITVKLKDIWWNPIYVLDNITVKIEGIDAINWYVFLDENKSLEKTFAVNNWEFTIPVYILKAVNNGTIKIRFSYNIPDMDWNDFKDLDLVNINVKEPINDINLLTSNTPIVWEIFTWEFNITYENNQWKINSISVTGDYNLINNSNLLYFITLTTADTWFNWKIEPINTDKTLSKVDAQYELSWYTVSFENFADINVNYNLSRNLPIIAYADKRVDYNKSFTWLVVTNSFTWWDTVNTLSFEPVLRDSHWYVIPDVKFDIKIKDAWIPNSYTGWDCNEVDLWYQKDCKALWFIWNENTYSWNIEGVLWTQFAYNTNWYTYENIKVVSYKPITWWKLNFEITNLENTSADWNFTNSGSYLNLPNYNWEISNIKFKPFLEVSLVWLDEEENYVDINNSIYLRLKNIASFDLSNVAYNLSWDITKPTQWVEFATGGILTGEGISIEINSIKNLEKAIMFELSYTYDDFIEFNYYNGYYKYNINWVWDLKLKPWYFYFNLWWKYKFGWSFVNGLITKIQKYAASVKNAVWRENTEISVKFEKVYNKLRKRAHILAQWAKKINNDTINIDDLNWKILYKNCNESNITITTWTYEWNNIILLENCKILIKWNIYKSSSEDNLVIFAFDSRWFDLTKKYEYLNRVSNIYIAENVSDIQASLLTRWTIFTIDWNSFTNIEDKVLLTNRTARINEKQLYINWSLMWQNNVWWAFLIKDEWKFTIWSSLKINKNDSFWGETGVSNLRKVAQIFDINFWRWFKYSWENSIDPSWYSNYCYTNTTEPWCKYPVYIKYDPTVKNNLLFK